LIAGDGVVEPRFTLATKGTWRQRQVFSSQKNRQEFLVLAGSLRYVKIQD